MIANWKYCGVLLLFFTGLVQIGHSQPMFSSSWASFNATDCKPPQNRQLFHGFIDEQQRVIQRSDGKNDNQYAPTAKEEINFVLTQALGSRVDALQCKIESDSTLAHQSKIKYLRGLENVLKFFSRNAPTRKVSPSILPDVIRGYDDLMQLDKEGRSIMDVVDRMSYETAYSLVRADIVTFEKNSGFKKAQDALVLKYCLLYPKQTLQTLTQYSSVPFADSLIKLAAKRNPKELYDYAQANNRLGSVIRNIKDDQLVETIVKMAQSKDGQQYFSFLDNIMRGKMTIEEIDKAKDDSVLYFRLLVKTRKDYVARAQNKDTALQFEILRQRLEKKARENFVNEINRLHDLRDLDVRFRSIQNLTAEELYYLAVSSDGTIYTSSFVKGVYPLMMKKINNRGDSLLMAVHFDKYRKLIKMCAGFNLLDAFLATFPKAGSPKEPDPALVLMRAFVKNLEKSDGLEDGVDVADSYASIAETLKPVADEMIRNIKENYQYNLSQNNKKGIAIYNILDKLFISADSTKKIDLTKELGIPPVYQVPFNSLKYDSTRVAVQLFIYGDKDGRGVFPSLISMFNNSNWKIDQSNKQWVTINSAKGKPVSLYMNRPLPEETNEDAEAQKALCEYLQKNNIIPTVTINRGHSYNAPYTIEQMSTASKIVFMGSCGGYRMIHDILEKAPDAHIIGTKQIADAPVNNPFLKLIMEELQKGSNIEWIPFWQELDRRTTDPIFDDYVPPYKNLGALFIKAYKIAMAEEGE